MRFTLGYQVLVAVLLGIACGLFFGPICGAIQPVGDIYVMLLQMIALPYIGFSLVHGVGSMTPSLCKKLLKEGWPFWLALWAIVFAVVYLLYLLIPAPLSATIRISEDRGTLLAKSFINYLVPENPFYDLVNNIVPAIAACGLIFGAALMHLQKKEPLLSFLGRSTQMIEKILTWLAIISPIGIFARIASTFGTVDFADLYSLEFYVVCFIVATLFITIWALPALVSSFTPLTYKEVLKAFRFVCLLPFATALPTIALPFIVIYMKKLGVKHAEGDPRFHATSQTVMPICYSFAQIGNCMILFFIFFLSFFFRHPFTLSEKAVLSLFTLPMSVGSSTTSISAVSFLIEQLNFPPEATELFMQTLSVTMNFQVLVSVASILSLIILVLYAYYGLLQIKWRALTYHFSAMAVVLILSFIVAKESLQLGDNFQNKYMDLRIVDVINHPVHARILQSRPVGTQNVESHESFSEILKSGIIKVGYSIVDIPYSYLNNYGELVGYDIAFAYQLARDLDCSIEFIPIEYADFNTQVINGEFNIAMSGIVMDEGRIKVMDFTRPYEQDNVVLIVPLSKRSEFLNLRTLQMNRNFKISAVGGFISAAQRHFPLSMINSSDQSFETIIKGEVDAIITTRLNGFVWTLTHPDFAVIDFEGLIGKRYFAYPIQSGDYEWLFFLNNWLTLKEESQFTEQMTRYWIKGDSIRALPRRWSFLENVLHWEK